MGPAGAQAVSKGADLRIEAVDHSVVSMARQLHAVQMIAYAQEARLLGAIYFPPLERTAEEVRTGAEAYLSAFIGAELAGATRTGQAAARRDLTPVSHQ